MSKYWALILVILLGVGGYYFYKNSVIKPTPTPTPYVLAVKVLYKCLDGKTIEASFYNGPQIAVKPGEPPTPTGKVDLVLSDGRKFTFPQTLSADGTRYANADESIVFWSKGDTSFITEGGKETYSCTQK